VIDKRVRTAAEALAGVRDGMTVMLSGFQGAGSPELLALALIETGVRDLTLISNSAGRHANAPGRLVAAGQVRKVIVSSARGLTPEPTPFEAAWARGAIELELVPQGTFVERIRAGGAGIPAFYTPVGAGTLLAEGKEVRRFGGRDCVLETALRADFALIHAERADRWGNLAYRHAQRNFGPAMAAAADMTVAEVDRIVELGEIAPMQVMTPGIYVDRVLEVPRATK
jgi:3-oxoadipate CoA-transferase alpha subunit